MQRSPAIALTASTSSEPEVVELLGRDPDQLVLANPGPERLVQVLVGRVHHHRGAVEEDDLVPGLDPARRLHELLAVDDLEPFLLEGRQHRELDDIHAEGRPVEPPRLQLALDLLGEVLRPAHLRRHRAAEERDPGARPLAEPGAVELVVARGRAEVPHDRQVAAREEREARELVARPLADGRGGDVADVVHVEAEERAQLRPGQRRRHPREPLGPQSVEVDPLFPVDAHRAVGRQSHHEPPAFEALAVAAAAGSAFALGGRPLSDASTSNTTAKS